MLECLTLRNHASQSTFAAGSQMKSDKKLALLQSKLTAKDTLLGALFQNLANDANQPFEGGPAVGKFAPVQISQTLCQLCRWCLFHDYTSNLLVVVTGIVHSEVWFCVLTLAGVIL